MSGEPHVISEMFLAGAIVKDGKLSIVDRGYVHTTAKLLQYLNIPVSPALAAAAVDIGGATAALEKIPYDYANISKLHGGRDYLAMPSEDRDLLIICNIPLDSRDRAETLEDMQLQRAWREAQKEADVVDSHSLSALHSAAEWRKKINADHPYIVVFHGRADALHADNLQTSDYASLHLPQAEQGVLVDRHYLRDMYFGLSKIWVEQKKMPPLIPVIQSLEKSPEKTVFEWNYNRRGFVPHAPASKWQLNF